MDLKSILNMQIEELQGLQEENIKAVVGIATKIENAVLIAEQIRKICP